MFVAGVATDEETGDLKLQVALTTREMIIIIFADLAISHRRKEKNRIRIRRYIPTILLGDGKGVVSLPLRYIIHFITMS